MGFAWWIDLTIALVLGAQLLGLSPPVAFLTAAAVALAAAASALMLERRLPDASTISHPSCYVYWPASRATTGASASKLCSKTLIYEMP